MRRILLAVFCLGLGGPALALSEIQGLVEYTCPAGQTCKAECTGPNTSFAVTYQQLTVFQWKDHVRRLWLAVNNEQFVLGDDTTCKFQGTPRFQFSSSPLGPPPQPPCVCIGNQCTPPNCRR